MTAKRMIEEQRTLYASPLLLGKGFAVRVHTAHNRRFGLLNGTKLPDRIMLDIDPGYSFGEGTHPTTQLCAEALERWVRPGTAVLDIGCGTGILSVLAARLGADRVAAADISPEAVKAARHNAALNGVQDRVFVRESDLTEAVDGTFDLAAANILADPLLRLVCLFQEQS